MQQDVKIASRSFWLWAIYAAAIPFEWQVDSKPDDGSRPYCDIGRSSSGRPLPDPTADLSTSSVLAKESGLLDPER